MVDFQQERLKIFIEHDVEAVEGMRVRELGLTRWTKGEGSLLPEDFKAHFVVLLLELRAAVEVTEVRLDCAHCLVDDLHNVQEYFVGVCSDLSEELCEGMYVGRYSWG